MEFTMQATRQDILQRLREVREDVKWGRKQVSKIKFREKLTPCDFSPYPDEGIDRDILNLGKWEIDIWEENAEDRLSVTMANLSLKFSIMECGTHYNPDMNLWIVDIIRPQKTYRIDTWRGDVRVIGTAYKLQNVSNINADIIGRFVKLIEVFRKGQVNFKKTSQRPPQMIVDDNYMMGDFVFKSKQYL